MTLTVEQKKAFERVLALRKLTVETGTITKRAQNAVLQALSDKDLIAVAEALESVQSGGAR